MHLHTSHVLGKSKHRLLELFVFLFLVLGTFWLSNSITLTKTQVCVCRCTHLCVCIGRPQVNFIHVPIPTLFFVRVLQEEYQMSLESAALLDWLVNETQGPACLLTHPALRSKKWVFGVQTKILMHRKPSALWATSA